MEKENKILEDQAWAHMEALLEKEMPVTKKRRLGLFWWIGISALVLVSIFAYVSLDNPSNDLNVNNKAGNQIYTENSSTESEPFENASEGDNHIELKGGNRKALTGKALTVDAESKMNSNSEVIAFENENSNRNQGSLYESASALSDRTITTTSNDVSELVSYSQNEYSNLKLGDSRKHGAEINKKNKQTDEEYRPLTIFNNSPKLMGVNDVIFESSKLQDRTDLISFEKLPMPIHELYVDDWTFDLEQKEIVKLVSEKGQYRTGVFASYQYLDQYFQGYDLGLSGSYDCAKYGIGLKVGYERLQNAKSPVLSDARVIVSNPNTAIGFNNDSSIFDNSKNAGFELNDIILNKSSLLTEVFVYYRVSTKFSLMSGLGYKRLLSVETRPINGADQNSMINVDPESLDELDGSQVLNNPSVNRNRLYLPLEVNYSLIRNLSIGVGTQFFITNAFEEFDEKNKSFYVRVNFKF